MEVQEGLYAYGVIDSGEHRKFGNNAYTIPFQDLAMVVKNVPNQVWQLSQENIKHHQETVSTIMKECTILPMAFGVIIPRETEARKLLEEAYEDLKNSLATVRGRVELGLKVLWQKDAFIAEMERDYDHLRQLKAEIQAMPPEQAYHHTIRLGQMVETAVLEKRRMYEQLIYIPLTELAVDARLNNPIGERMVFNAAFLVEKSLEMQFDQRVNGLFEQYQHLFLFRYSGPWPPYNFVNLRLNRGRLSG